MTLQAPAPLSALEYKSCNRCGHIHPIGDFKLYQTSNRGNICRDCRTRDERARHAKRKAQKGDKKAALERAIKSAQLPAAERWTRPRKAWCWDPNRNDWLDSLILGEHVTQHGQRLAWVAVLDIPGRPRVATFRRDWVAVEQTKEIR